MPFRRIIVLVLPILLFAGLMWTLSLYLKAERGRVKYFERWAALTQVTGAVETCERKILAGDVEGLRLILSEYESWWPPGKTWGGKMNSDFTKFYYGWLTPLFNDLQVVFSDEYAETVLARLSDEDVENLASRRDFDVSKYGVDFSEHRVEVGEGLKVLLFDRMREAMDGTSGNQGSGEGGSNVGAL